MCLYKIVCLLLFLHPEEIDWDTAILIDAISVFGSSFSRSAKKKADRIFWISVTFLANEHYHFHRGSVSLWPWKPRLNPTVTVNPASLFRPLSLSRLFPTWIPQAEVGCLSLFRLSFWHTDLLNLHGGWRATLAGSFSPELVCQIITRCKC